MIATQNSKIFRRRRGAVLIVALACLVIVMALSGQMLVGALRCSRQMHVERDLLQCEYLLQAGVDRAARRLEADGAYAGEMIEAPPSELGGVAAGRLTIAVSRVEGEPPRIRVQAEYPLGSDKSIRRSRSFTLGD